MSDTLRIILIMVIVIAIAFIVRFLCIECKRRARINRSWRQEQALRERERE